jgi:protein phosphatase
MSDDIVITTKMITALARAHILSNKVIVCDGMGGHEAGEVASRLAVANILSSYYDNEDEDRALALSVAFDTANTVIFNEGNQSGVSMGTTGVATILHRDECVVANVGDSRAYLIRRGAIRQ